MFLFIKQLVKVRSEKGKGSVVCNTFPWQFSFQNEDQLGKHINRFV